MMNPTRISTRILLLLLSLSSLVAAVNFTQCMEDFKQDFNTIADGGVDSQGRPVSPAEAVGLTYRTCVELCRTDATSFVWGDFARSFSSWLLPWLALLSQLPFGSSNYVDDFVSVITSVGSPALAAYSLVLTSLTTRSVYRRASRVNHGSRAAVAAALISLQQLPLELTKDERLLASIPISDWWRQEIGDRLSRRGTWSLATVKSIVWVVIIFLFALVDSFVSLDFVDNSYEGYAISILWLWLLCLVIGWLWVPTFTRSELRSAPRFANQQSVKKTATKVGWAATAGGPPKQTQIPKGRKRLVIDPVPQVFNDENKKVEVESIQEDAKREEYDQKAGSPSNPTHHQSITESFQSPPDIQQGHDHLAVSANPNADQITVSMARPAQSSINPETDELFIPQKLTSLNRDEHRLTATFNYSRVMRYLVLVDDVLTALDQRTSASGVIPTLPVKEKVVFPPGAFASMFNAAVMALILQCGTAAAATITMVFTPTVGLGCRSLGYTIYGGTAVVIMFLTIISTIFARISEISTSVKDFTAFIAIALRRISFLLALINGVGLIVFSCFQFSHFLDNCYCNASVLSRGTGSHIIIFAAGSVTTMRNSRIVGAVLSGVVMVVYVVFIWLISAINNF